MAKQPDYEAMSIEELESVIQALGEKRAEIAEQQRAVHRILDKKLTARAVLQKLATLSEAERVAFAQQLTAKGVESEEQFGKVG